MFVEFDSLKDSARVWIYQTNNPLTQEQTDAITKALIAFTEQWAAHNQPLKSSFKIYYNQFIVLAADESFNKASGCSIDTATRIFQNIDKEYNLGLFDRTQVAFSIDDKIVVLPMSELAKMKEVGFWDSETLVFNNVIGLKSDLRTNWIKPANQTWLKRYLKNAVV